MDALKVGKAIAYLRKKVGYTQRELANRIGVSDKAVSKWERGIGLPDTSIIGKLAILLDTDTDSLLAGDIIHHNSGWTGLLIMDQNENGINAGTVIGDKPLFHFFIGYFMLMGISEIRIVADCENKKIIERELSDGSEFGISLSYWNEIPLQLYRCSDTNVMIVLGKSFLFGVDQSRFFQKAMIDRSKFTILSLPKKKNESFTHIYYDLNKKIVFSEDGDKLMTQYNYHQMPIMFCPAKDIEKIKFSKSKQSGDISISILGKDMYTVILDRGFVEIPINNWEDVTNASLFMQIVQRACGMQIYCLEEIAWRRGLISYENFVKAGQKKGDTICGRYILEIARNYRK